ncbi:hypothetical protein GCM10017600_50210 [Streptosporangium carneum]|uniref:Uncharacterized protein n=1 Tax=Streptosporangium carneum TaxID=47481 RepID=A0A9W6I611_9ACTN|nr:hypothetical protein GCM10017600_50210 [Streptosporangium carneum]
MAGVRVRPERACPPVGGRRETSPGQVEQAVHRECPPLISVLGLPAKAGRRPPSARPHRETSAVHSAVKASCRSRPLETAHTSKQVHPMSSSTPRTSANIGLPHIRLRVTANAVV